MQDLTLATVRHLRLLPTKLLLLLPAQLRFVLPPGHLCADLCTATSLCRLRSHLLEHSNLRDEFLLLPYLSSACLLQFVELLKLLSNLLVWIVQQLLF